YDAERISKLLTSLNVPPHRAVIAGHHDDGLPAKLQKVTNSLGQTTGHGMTPLLQLGEQASLGGDDGCMSASRNADSTVAASHADFIINARKRAVKNNIASMKAFGPIDNFPGRQRAFVKVQDGCDAFCTYCIVPYTRSVVWSRSIEEIDAECRRLVRAGHKEIVLSGIFLGAFGRESTVRKRWDKGSAPLVNLVDRIAPIKGLWRLRLSSLEPDDLTDEVLDLWSRHANIAPHLHLPLQSGSETILRRMNRQYTVEAFCRTIERVNAALDRPAVTTDIIVGFPGESDADFTRTLDVARKSGFAKIHAFPFSAIEGTAAWAMRREAPPTKVVKERLAALAEVERETADIYRRKFLGETIEGLVETARKAPATRRAMTDRYIAVHFRSNGGDDLTGQVVALHINAVTSKGLEGTIVEHR
ncbi:MAG: MiaB/RimO family radical SAM methylthiotransferase, partial [Planctomycetes bacterium]|nr:MiaB/RimO family radical SAM methylthiotransferase [Planctomycetota bacterium]